MDSAEACHRAAGSTSPKTSLEAGHPQRQGASPVPRTSRELLAMRARKSAESAVERLMGYSRSLYEISSESAEPSSPSSPRSA